jgi:hypothetical protein
VRVALGIERNKAYLQGYSKYMLLIVAKLTSHDLQDPAISSRGSGRGSELGTILMGSEHLTPRTSGRASKEPCKQNLITKVDHEGMNSS